VPRINQRFLLALLAIATVLGGALYGAYVFQVSRQTDFFLEQAEKAYEEGRIESAANLYRRVIEHDPDNPLALDKLASCLDQMGKHVAAYIA
jgi:Flp pilus assembly protein TadD